MGKVTHARKRNPCTYCDELLYRCKGPRRNHLCHFLWLPRTGFRRDGGVIFWASPLTCIVACMCDWGHGLTALLACYCPLGLRVGLATLCMLFKCKISPAWCSRQVCKVINRPWRRCVTSLGDGGGQSSETTAVSTSCGRRPGRTIGQVRGRAWCRLISEWREYLELLLHCVQTQSQL